MPNTNENLKISWLSNLSINKLIMENIKTNEIMNICSIPYAVGSHGLEGSQIPISKKCELKIDWKINVKSKGALSEIVKMTK